MASRGYVKIYDKIFLRYDTTRIQLVIKYMLRIQTYKATKVRESELELVKEQGFEIKPKTAHKRSKGQLTKVLVAKVHSEQDLDEVSLQTFFSPAHPPGVCSER